MLQKNNRPFYPDVSTLELKLRLQLMDDYKMMHKAWRDIRTIAIIF